MHGLNNGIPLSDAQMSSDRWCRCAKILQMAVQKIKVPGTKDNKLLAKS